MSMKRLSAWMIGLSVCGAGLAPQKAMGWTDMAFRGEMTSWANQAMTLENGIWRTSVGAPATDGSSEFQFYSSDGVGGTFWGGGFWFSPNTFYDVPQGGNALITPAGVTAGNYYTFTVVDASDLHVFMQETVAAPISINSFSGEVGSGGSFDRASQSGDSSGIANNVNTITATLSAAPSAGENVYIAYSTDNFATKPTIVQASGAGTSWSANIGAQAGDTTVNYYVLTSTFSAGVLNGVGGEIDQLFRALDETKASTQNYTIYDTGNSFHIQSQVAGSSGNTMLDGGNLSGGLAFDGTEASAFIYSGNVFQNATVARDQSSLTLYYRVNGGGWSSQGGTFDNTTVNDKYWLSTLDLTGLSAGDLVEYYFGINYTDADPTYVYRNGANSFLSGNQTLAQNQPFNFEYGESEDPPPNPGGAVPEPSVFTFALVGGVFIIAIRRRLLNSIRS